MYCEPLEVEFEPVEVDFWSLGVDFGPLGVDLTLQLNFASWFNEGQFYASGSRF